jgi:DNA-binding NarL/FixJ family response regulator
MRVLLADDHALVRAGIRALLAGLPDVESVVEAGDGQEALTPAISKQVVDGYLGRAVPVPTSAGDSGGLDVLTSRQREILQLVAEGKSTKEVAQLLDVSAKTVETHRAQIMERLGIHDLAGLVRYAIRTGLVSPDR